MIYVFFKKYIGHEKVWHEEFGAVTSGKCPIFGCQNILSKNISNSWQCGHIISHNNDGTTTIKNLRPLCTHVIEQ